MTTYLIGTNFTYDSINGRISVPFVNSKRDVESADSYTITSAYTGKKLIARTASPTTFIIEDGLPIGFSLGVFVKLGGAAIQLSGSEQIVMPGAVSSVGGVISTTNLYANLELEKVDTNLWAVISTGDWDGFTYV